MTPGADNQRRYRIRRRERATQYLGGKCVKCGSSESLEFDHIEPETKTKDISQAIIAAWSWERLREELDKCQLLCSDHHHEKTINQGCRSKFAWNKVENPNHGTAVMYGPPWRCRCDACVEWKRLYRRKAVDTHGNTTSP